MNRDEYRKIKAMSKEQIEEWLSRKHNLMYSRLRKDFNEAYEDELNNSIQNFITAIAYTLHYNEDLHLEKDEMASFMEDLFVTTDLFRTGEYKPKDYEKQLKEDGVILEKYDNDKMYRDYRQYVLGLLTDDMTIDKLKEILEEKKDEQIQKDK